MNIRNIFATVFSENRAFWQSGLDKQIFWQSGLLTIGLLTNGLSDNRAIWQQGGHHRVRTQNFAFSQSSNFWPHTWFFLSLDFPESFRVPHKYIKPSASRFWAWSDFFWIIKVFLFSRSFNFTRKYLTKVAETSLHTSHPYRQPLVKLFIKIRPAVFVLQGVTHEQTDGRTDTLTDKGQRS